MPKMNGLVHVRMDQSVCPRDEDSTYKAAMVQEFPRRHDSSVTSTQAEPNVPANPRECTVKVGVLPSVIGQKKTVSTVSSLSIGSTPV